ncbi:MAG TPA: glycosyltransferase [Phnomibacter sp.]|nr:glycosyltransferase [Phnomibacter sp.]
MNKKRKIAIFINDLSAGGCERTASILINKLSNEFDWLLILLNDNIHYEIPDGIPKVVFSGEVKGWRQLFYLFTFSSTASKVKIALENFRADTLISFNHLPNSIAARIKKRGWLGKLIISEQVHCSTYISELKSPLKRWVKRREISKYYSYADLIVPNAVGIASDLKDTFSINTAITVVHSPIDLEQAYRQMQAKRPAVFHKLEGKFIIIHVGRYEPQKNHQLLISAFKMAALPNAVLLLVGQGTLFESTNKLIQELNLQESVLQVGVQTNPFVYLAASQVFALSSDYEGFPNVLLEALASGLAIVSTNCQCGPSEILNPNQEIDPFKGDVVVEAAYGLLVPVQNTTALAESFKLLYRNHALRTLYQQKAKVRASDFAVDKIISQYRTIFQS